MSLASSSERLNIPFVMVIFGATGDLTRRKLVPGLFELFQNGFLPDQFSILGFARRDWTKSDFIEQAGSELPGDAEQLQQFFDHFEYQRGDFDEADDYRALEKRLQELDDAVGQCGRRLLYLATPTESYQPILKGIKLEGLQHPCGKDGWTRLVIEKPFGHDLTSATELDKEIGSVFTEDQIYRIDHYLAKETVQNILTFRFANAMFEPIWNRDNVASITIEVREAIGIGTRGNFYDRTGAIRDVTQNHLLQLLALVTMEQPSGLSEAGFRDARARLLQAVCCFDLEHLSEHVVLGQYEGYQSEANVNIDSRTETFAALKVEVHNERWMGVPVYLLTGKKLKEAESSITIRFKQPEDSMYEKHNRGHKYNELRFSIQPKEGITLKLLAKRPGFTTELKPVEMHFDYTSNFNTKSIDAYSKLLLDAVNGDQTLFTRSDEVEAEWQFVDPIIEKISQLHIKPTQYENGSDGPKDAEQLLSST